MGLFHLAASFFVCLLWLFFWFVFWFAVVSVCCFGFALILFGIVMASLDCVLVLLQHGLLLPIFLWPNILLFPFLGWCVRLPEVLYPLVSHCLPYCLPTCVPVLDGPSAFPRSYLGLSSDIRACVGWRVRLPEVLSLLVSDCFPVSPRMCACVGWCVRLPKMLSPLVSHCLPTCVPTNVRRCVRLPEVLFPLVSH